MSNSNRGPLATYNSLTDRHLAGFFANSRVREHLRRSGLITAEGEIINDATYRLNMARKDHKKHVKDLLAQAIVHKTLDIERLRQIEVKRRLEEIAKLETVRRIKQTRDRKSEDMLLPLLSPSAQPRQFSARSLQQSRSSTRDALDRPASAPDQEPFQGGDKQKDNLDELPIDALRDYAITMNYEHTKRKDYNPYRVPQIPLPPKKDRVNRQTAKAQRIRQQQLQNKMKMEERPVYAGTEYRRPMPPMVHMPVLQSYCTVIMRYHGYGLNLVRQEIDYRQEIMVDQQHCGGNTRTVFKDMLAPGATFKFSSLRHQGYPFSLTLYIDGKVDSRVSTCCEFGHRPGSKLGHFSFVDIEGSSAKPCYKCQMGLTRPISHRRTPANPRPQSETVTVVNTRSGAASAQSQSRPQSRAQEQQQPTSEENVVVAVEKDEEEAAEEEEAAAKSPAPAAEEEAQAEAVGYADDFEEESKHSKEDEEEEEQTGKVEGLDDELSDREEPVVRARSASPAPSQDSSSSSSASRSVYSSSFEDDSGSEAGDKPGPDQQDAGKKDDEDRNDDGKDEAPGNDDDVQTPRVKGVGSDDDDDYDDDDDTRNVRGSPDSAEPKRAPDTKVMRRVPEHQGRYQTPVSSVTDLAEAGKDWKQDSHVTRDTATESQQDVPTTTTTATITATTTTTGDEDGTKTTATETRGDEESETQESVEESDTAGGQEASELRAETPAPREVAGSVLEGVDPDSQDLSLSNVNLNSAKVEEVCQWIMSKANVQSVSLRNVGLTDLHLQRLVDALLSTASLPRVLNLSGNQLTDACVDTLLRFLRSVSCLDILVLQGNRLGDEGVARLAEGLLRLQDAARAGRRGGRDSEEDMNERGVDGVAVTELDLSQLGLSDRATLGLAQLLEADFPLARLSLAANPDISLEGWTCLGLALKKNSHLAALSLGHNQLGDQGVEMLARALKHTRTVHQVDLEDNDVGAAGARCLHKLARDNPCVWELTLTPGNRLPPDFLQEIQRLLERNRRQQQSDSH